MIKVFILLW